MSDVHTCQGCGSLVACGTNDPHTAYLAGWQAAAYATYTDNIAYAERRAEARRLASPTHAPTGNAN